MDWPFLIIIVLFYPFQTTIVPAWRIRVIDEKGSPYVAKEVLQSWKHYSLETDAAENHETRITDAEGYVAFPERTIRMGLLMRALLTAYAYFRLLLHGSVGIRSYIYATGPAEYKVVHYSTNAPMPQVLILKMK